MDANTEQLAQNTQDQVEAAENFQQALLTAVNDAADRRNAIIDRWSRSAKALGRRSSTPHVHPAESPTCAPDRRTCRACSRRREGRATPRSPTQVRQTRSTTSTSRSRGGRAAVPELHRRRQQRSAGGRARAGSPDQDRPARRPDQLRAMGNILQRGNVLQNQRAGLLGLLGQAQRAGNAEQVDNLVDQIDELNTQMAENTQAIQDNTDAAFNFRTSAGQRRLRLLPERLPGRAGLLPGAHGAHRNQHLASASSRHCREPPLRWQRSPRGSSSSSRR
jgi:hypothetical protein